MSVDAILTHSASPITRSSGEFKSLVQCSKPFALPTRYAAGTVLDWARRAQLPKAVFKSIYLSCTGSSSEGERARKPTVFIFINNFIEQKSKTTCQWQFNL